MEINVAEIIGVGLIEGVGGAVFNVKDKGVGVGVTSTIILSEGGDVGAAKFKVTGILLESPLVGDKLLPLNLLKDNK